MSDANDHELSLTPNTAPAETSDVLVESRPDSIGAAVRTLCLVLIAAGVTGASMYALATILQPLLIALMLLFVFRRISRGLEDLNMPRWLAQTLLLAGIIMGSWWLGRVVLEDTQDVLQRFPAYRARWEELTVGIAGWTRFEAEPPAAVDAPTEADPPSVVQLPAAPEDRDELTELLLRSRNELLGHLFGATLEFLEIGVLVVFYLLFLIIEAQRLPGRIARGMKDGSGKQLTSIGTAVDQSIQAYLSFKTVVSVGLGLSTAILGYLFGLDFWPLWGVLMFLANYITYLGSMAACIPPIAIAVLQFDRLWVAAVFGLVLILVRLVWIDWVEIRYSGKQLNVSPLLLLLSLAFFGTIWGLVGMVIAVPLVTSIKIMLDHFPETRYLAALISEE